MDTRMNGKIIEGYYWPVRVPDWVLCGLTSPDEHTHADAIAYMDKLSHLRVKLVGQTELDQLP